MLGELLDLTGHVQVVSYAGTTQVGAVGKGVKDAGVEGTKRMDQLETVIPQLEVVDDLALQQPADVGAHGTQVPR